MQYTLPQIGELLSQTKKNIEFQIEMSSMKMFGGSLAGTGENTSNDEEYEIANEDDIRNLANFLSG